MKHAIYRFREYPAVLKLEVKEFDEIAQNELIEAAGYFFRKTSEGKGIYKLPAEMEKLVEDEDIKLIAVYSEERSCFFIRDDFDFRVRELFNIHKLIKKREKPDQLDLGYLSSIRSILKSLPAERKLEILENFPTNTLSSNYPEDVQKYMLKEVGSFPKPPDPLTAAAVGFLISDQVKEELNLKEKSYEEKLKVMKRLKTFITPVTENLIEAGVYGKFEKEYKDFKSGNR